MMSDLKKRAVDVYRTKLAKTLKEALLVERYELCQAMINKLKDTGITSYEIDMYIEALIVEMKERKIL